MLNHAVATARGTLPTPRYYRPTRIHHCAQSNVTPRKEPPSHIPVRWWFARAQLLLHVRARVNHHRAGLVARLGMGLAAVSS